MTYDLDFEFIHKESVRTGKIYNWNPSMTEMNDFLRTKLAKKLVLRFILMHLNCFYNIHFYVIIVKCWT